MKYLTLWFWWPIICYSWGRFESVLDILGKCAWTDLCCKFTGWPLVFPFSSLGKGNEGITLVLWDLLISGMLSLFLDKRVRLRVVSEFHELHFLFPELPNISATFKGSSKCHKKAPSSPTLIFPGERQRASGSSALTATGTHFIFSVCLKSSVTASWGGTRVRGKELFFDSVWFVEDALVLTSCYGDDLWGLLVKPAIT